MHRSGSASAVSQGGRAARRRVALVVSVALLASALIAGLAGWHLKPSPLPPPSALTRVALTVPADEQLAVAHPSIAVSPDGAHLVYVASRRGVQQLHLRPLDSLKSTALVGTEGAAAPFFSPDSQWVGFFAGGKLKKIPVTGGAALIVCDARDSFGGSWSPKDVIYFSPGSSSGLWQVSAKGGTPQPFTKLDPQKGEIGHRWPQVLPGGDAVLFTSRTGPGSDEWDVQVQRVSSGERHMVVHGGPGHYVPTGHLVYMQLATGTLVAVPFDPAHLQVGATPPVAVAEGILTREGAHYTVSGNGLLAYVPARLQRRGSDAGLGGPPGEGRPAECTRASVRDTASIPRWSARGLHDGGSQVRCVGLRPRPRERHQTRLRGEQPVPHLDTGWKTADVSRDARRHPKRLLADGGRQWSRRALDNRGGE